MQDIQQLYLEALAATSDPAQLAGLFLFLATAVDSHDYDFQPSAGRSLTRRT